MCLEYTEMLQTIQFLSDTHARSPEKSIQNTVSGLDPSWTALFFGVREDSDCSMQKSRQYRRYVRRTLKKLLKAGVTTILAETSTLFGYYALDELIRQRWKRRQQGKHALSLLAIHLEGNRYHWMHTDEKPAEERTLRNTHNFILCDRVLSPISRDGWQDLLANHVCLAFMEKPYCIRNMRVLSLEEFNKWGAPFDEEKAQDIVRWMLG